MVGTLAPFLIIIKVKRGVGEMNSSSNFFSLSQIAAVGDNSTYICAQKYICCFLLY